MNAARIELALILEHVDIPINLQSFSNRLQIQKKIYLIQVAGTDLGYRFGWYIRGPYSPALTQDAYTLKDEIASGISEHQSFRLTPNAVKALEKAKEIWERPSDFALGDDSWLELLASVHYLRHIAYRPHGATRGFDEVFELLIQSKPHFANRKKEARQAWKRLDQIGLVEAKTL